MPTDTEAERQMKYLRINANYKDLKSIQESKINEILSALELFNGSLSLNDILNQDIPIINSLVNAKSSQLQRGTQK